MNMTQETLKAKLDAHALWLKTRFTNNIQGGRADLTDADLTHADLTHANLTDANLNIWRASPFVCEAIAAAVNLKMALMKTRFERRKDNS